MSQTTPPDELLDQVRQAIARLFERMRQLEDRIARLEQHSAGSVELPTVGPQPWTEEPQSVEPVISASLVSDDTSRAPVGAESIATTGAASAASGQPLSSAHDDPFARSKVGSATRPGGVGSAFEFEKLIGGRWLTWIGAFVLILAVAFFVPWAWQHFEMPGWIRVLVFNLIGVGALLIGHFFDRKKLPVFARGLAGVGIFTLYAAAWAAQHHYRIWGDAGETVTFLQCALVTVAAIAIAVRANSVAVILLGALGGYLTPFIASGVSLDHIGVFTYLAFLNVALIGCAVIKSWRFLKPLVVVATALTFAVWLLGDFAPEHTWSTQWLVVLHFAIFLCGTTIPPVILRRRSNVIDSFALVAGSMWFVSTTWLLFHESPEQQMALVCWGVSALHFVLFTLTYKRVGNTDRMPRVQLALGALFFTLAAPLQMEDSLEYLSVAWCAQGLMFTAVGVYFRDRQMCVSALVVFTVAVIRLFGFDFFPKTETITALSLDRRFLLFMICAGMILLAGGLYWIIGRAVNVLRGEASDEIDADAQHVFWEPVGGLLLAAGNVVLLAGLTRQWDGRVVLVMWTVDAAVCWAIGFIRSSTATRTYALIIGLLFVGTRTIFHGDAVSEPFRLVFNDRFLTAGLVAALYFSAGWFYRRNRLQHETRLRTVDPLSEPMLTDWQQSETRLDSLLGILANTALVVAISLEIGSWFTAARDAGQQPFPNMRTAELATYSIVWAIYAAIVVACGFALRYQLFRILGLVAFLFILGKVFFLDLASLSLLPRVLALAVLGAMLMGVSLLYQRFTGRIDDAGRADESA